MNDDHGFSGCMGCLSVVLVILLVLAEICRGALVNPADSIRAAETMGFRDASVVSSTLLPGLNGCDGGDALAVTVKATNSNGQRVDLLACSGWPFKGWTVRVK